MRKSYMIFKVLIVCMVGVTALCSCTATSNGDIDVYDTEYREHDYLIFENGHLSYDQHKDFNDACARLRVHSEEANDYVVASIIKVHDIMKSTFNTRHRTLNTSLRKMGY